MNTFFYRGISENGDFQSGYYTANNKKQAIIELQEKGVIVDKIRFSYKGFNFFIKKSSFKLVINSIYELISSGLSMSEVLNFLIKYNSNPKLNLSIQLLLNDINNGENFSASLKKQFTGEYEFYFSILETSEKVGNLERGLKEILDMMDERESLNNQIITAITYPVILFFLMISMLYIILNYVLPNIISNLDGVVSLPISTKILIYIEIYASPIILLIFLVFILFSTIIIVNNRFTKSKKILERILLSVPVYNFYLNLYTRGLVLKSMSFGLRGGLNILEANRSIIYSMSSNYMRDKFKKVIEDLENGNRISSSYDNLKLFSKLEIETIKIADETDKLQKCFTILSKNLEKKVLGRIKFISKIIEPAILILFGLIILIIALGVMMPVLLTTQNIDI